MGEAVLRLSETPAFWQRIERFLGTKIADVLTMREGFSIMENLDPKKVEDLIFERAPFLCIEKAIVIEKQGNIRLLSMAVITKEMCDGHFPNRLMIPLLVFSKIIALTGELLVAWVKKSGVVPLAVRASEVKTASRDLVAPPTLVVTEAEFLREKGPYCWVTAKSWVGNNNVAIMKDLVYYLMPADQFFSGAQME